MKLCGWIVVIVAAVPVCGQSPQAGFEHGHKIGSNVTFLTEYAGDAKAAQTEEILANLQLHFAELTGKSTAAVSQRPCAAFETWVEQASSDLAESAGSGISAIERTEGKAVIHRFVRDNTRQIYVSYTVTVETLPDGTYRLSFGSPEEAPAQVRSNADWKVLSPAKFPVPQIVRDEDSIRLELYSDGTAWRMIEYVHAGRQDRMDPRKETPHDSYAEDAELAITAPRLRVNGVAGTAGALPPETIRGPVLWIYVPGHGRYVLSLHAQAEMGFENDGEVAGNSLTFTAPDGNVFRIETAERIAPGSGTYALHVLPDLGWMPADPQDRGRMMIGAASGIHP